MKRFVVLIVLITLVANCFAQPLLQPGKKWYALRIGWAYHLFTNVYETSGDTVIDSTLYKEISSDQGYSHFLREDSSGKVFSLGVEEEELLYDFNLTVNDTFRGKNLGIHVELIVDTVDTVTLLNGEQRKRIIFKYDEVWIEGIGSLNGLMEVYFGYAVSDNQFLLKCFEKNGELLYRTTIYDSSSCYLSGNLSNASMSLHTGDTKVYPNPAADKIWIEVEQFEPPYTFELTDISGKAVLKKQFVHGKAQVNVSELKSGFYLYNIADKAGRSSTGKLIIK